MENTGFKIEFRIFYFIHLPNEKDYERKESSTFSLGSHPTGTGARENKHSQYGGIEALTLF